MLTNLVVPPPEGGGAAGTGGVPVLQADEAALPLPALHHRVAATVLSPAAQPGQTRHAEVET